jgi:hypothetical protein
MNAVAVFFLYRLGRLFFRQTTSGLIAISYAFSTISWPFATFFFQSDVSAALDVIAVYFILRAARGSVDLSSIIIGGFAVAFAVMVDYVNFLLLPVLLTFVVFSLREDKHLARKTGAIFSLCALTGVLALGLYNYACFGNPVVSTEQLYLHSSSFLGNFTTPIYLGLLLNLFTPLRGIFFYSPILILGVLGFKRMLSTIRREGLLILAVFMVLFLPYCAWYGPTGGLAFGPRFLVASFPFLLLPAGYVIETTWRYRKPVIYALYSAGVIVNGLAAITSALAGTSNWLASPFLSSTLPTLTRGTLDQWWLSDAGASWPVVGAGIIGATLLLPIIFWQRDPRS